MIRLFAAASIALASPLLAQSSVGIMGPVRVQLDAVPTSSLVVMLMRDVMRVPYVIAPEVLNDRRPVSVSLVIPRDKVPERVVAYLRKSGFTVELQGGTVYVSRGGRAVSPYGASSPMGSPLSPAEPINYQSAGAASPVAVPLPDDRGGRSVSAGSLFVAAAFIPAHRNPDYLSSVVAPLFPDCRLGARAAVKGDVPSASVVSEENPDLFVFACSADDLPRVKQLLTVLDRPRPMVSVKAVIMQVQSVQTRGSALSLFASLAGGRVGAGSFADAVPGGQFLRISTGALRAVLSAVREDSRFRVVASPNLAALSGGVASMNAGAQVPTVGAVAVTDGGTPVRSVVYRDSGVILTVRPTVRGQLVQLDVREERSSFVPTTTGVEDSPTLQRSSVDGSVIVSNGESVVLAGLTEASAGNKREGLLGGLLGVRSRDKSESELLVVLTAEIVPAAGAPAGTFVDLDGKDKTDDLAPA